MLEASVIVPTRDRAGYLSVALESLAAQDLEPGSYEVVVVDDGPGEATRAATQAAAERSPVTVRYVEREGAAGPELGPQHRHRCERGAVRGVRRRRRRGPAAAGCGRCSTGRRRHPDALVLGGPIEVRLEGFRLPLCGREAPPITTLDAGPADREVDVVWGANMGIDRRAFDLAGTFDPGVPYGFDEDMWERRLRERGGHVMYVADAGLVHRRDAADSRLRPLMRAAYRARTGAARILRASRAVLPPRRASCAVLAGCFLHTSATAAGTGSC